MFFRLTEDLPAIRPYLALNLGKFLQRVSLIRTVIVRDIAEMVLRVEAEDMCFVVKLCQSL